ncbi:MAG: serine/threonine-protein phosphatase [Myxococcales bacterium]|nr:serine/threonine-protein phosphatase [Myxococcales bacterium]
MDVMVHAVPYHGSDSGGDLHYVSTCLRGAITRFMVADVSGHGEGVGDLALKLRKLLRKNINTPDQSRLTRQLNEEFSRLASSGRFATAVIATYYGPTNSLIVSNAGHPPPLWYSASRDEWSLLVPDAASAVVEVPGAIANLPLGIIEPTEYRQFTVQLGLGDVLMLYTDSLIESADSSGRQVGPQGLLELARSIGACEPSSLCDALLDRLTSYRGGADSDDDVTLMILRHNAGQASQSLGEWASTLGRLITGR